MVIFWPEAQPTSASNLSLSKPEPFSWITALHMPSRAVREGSSCGLLGKVVTFRLVIWMIVTWHRHWVMAASVCSSSTHRQGAAHIPPQAPPAPPHSSGGWWSRRAGTWSGWCRSPTWCSLPRSTGHSYRGERGDRERILHLIIKHCLWWRVLAIHQTR